MILKSLLLATLLAPSMANDTDDHSHRDLQNGRGVKARVSRLERKVDDIYHTLDYLKGLFDPDNNFYGLFESFSNLEENYKHLQEQYDCLRSSGYHVNEYGDLVQDFHCYGQYYQHNLGHVVGPPGRCDCHDDYPNDYHDDDSDDIGEITVLPSCRAYYEAGYTHDGIYAIDPDGPNNGVDVFKVWCDQTTTIQTPAGVNVTGGWALFAYHRGGQNPKKILRSFVSPDEFAVSFDNHWKAIRSTMEYGMIFIDEFNQTTAISKDVLENETNCHSPSQNPSLIGGRNKFLFWKEADCNADGEDYCGVTLHANRAAGASLAAQCGVEIFDAWPYNGTLSFYEQRELKYFVG